MLDPQKHIVLDANVLIAGLLPKATENPALATRAQALLKAVTVAEWPSFVLYTPGICVAEAMSTFDKYRYGTWHGSLRNTPSRRITSSEHAEVQSSLDTLQNSRAFHYVEQHQRHVFAAGLISPINQHFEDCGDPNAKRPMSATDCVIAGMAISLGQQVSRESVVLTTDDRRLAAVFAKAQTLSSKDVTRLHLDSAAKRIGFPKWDPTIYPRCVSLGTANDRELSEAFLGWPLPNHRLEHKTATQLTDPEKSVLVEIWLAMRTRMKLGGEDSLPYSPALDELRTAFSTSTGAYLPNNQIYRALQNMRKAGEMAAIDKSDPEPDHPLFA